METGRSLSISLNCDPAWDHNNGDGGGADVGIGRTCGYELTLVWFEQTAWAALLSSHVCGRYNEAMPAEQTLVSVEEYLNTSYEGPDREYVDGRIVERNVGERSHS